MSYNIKYKCEFDSVAGTPYQLDILQLNYVGAIIPVIGGDSPVQQKWQTDDPEAAIKGQEMSIKLVNENGALPLTNFYTNNDFEFKANFYNGAQLLFSGFLVQDDISETFADFTHYINLSFTDGLGLLRDVPLSDSSKAYKFKYAAAGIAITTTAPNTVSSTLDFVSKIAMGDVVFFDDGALFKATYHIVEIVNTTQFKVLENVVPFAGNVFAEVRETILIGKLTVAQFLNIALGPTNLLLNTNAYSTMYPVGGTTTRWLEDTLIDTYTFLEGENFNDCHTVITQILSGFGATLLQAKGEWNIIRRGEHIYGALTGFSYTSNYTYIAPVTYVDSFTAGIGTAMVAETGLDQSVERPLKFVKKTFDYKQKTEIFRNANLLRLGNLITSYGVGATTVKEYVAKDYFNGFFWNTFGGVLNFTNNPFFIRVTTDVNGFEIERVLVIKNLSSSQSNAVRCFPIELSTGDNIEISFDARTNQDMPAGARGRGFSVAVVQTPQAVTALSPRSASARTLLRDENWYSYPVTPPANVGGLNVQIAQGDNLNQWHTFSAKSKASPFDTLLFIFLPQIHTEASKETYIRNINFKINAGATIATNIKGQVHIDEHSLNVNNKQADDLTIDDSKSNYVSGTLFNNTLTAYGINNKTTRWQYHGFQFPLGRITTFEQLFRRRLPRQKLEGTFYGLLQTGHISALSIVKYNSFTGLNFGWGACEIDFANDSISGTLYEMYKDAEVVTDLLHLYTFKYLYANNE